MSIFEFQYPRRKFGIPGATPASTTTETPFFFAKLSSIKTSSGEKDIFKGLNNVDYCSTISDACLKADLIILHTEWNDFKLLNFKKLTKKRKFKIYDMRNMYSPLRMKKLKINYFGVGR